MTNGATKTERMHSHNVHSSTLLDIFCHPRSTETSNRTGGTKGNHQLLRWISGNADTHLLNIPQTLKREKLFKLCSLHRFFFCCFFFFLTEKSCDQESQGSRSVITIVERCQTTFSAWFTSPHLIQVLDILSRGTEVVYLVELCTLQLFKMSLQERKWVYQCD